MRSGIRPDIRVLAPVRILALAIAQALAASVTGCSPSAESARMALERSGIAVETSGFVDAARDRGPQTLGLFIAAGLDPNRLDSRNGISPLMAAASAARLDNAKLLLDKGASVRLRSRSAETALMFAAFDCTSPEMIGLLLAAGADPNARDARGDTALFKFIRDRPRDADRCSKEVLLALLQAGARVDEENAEAETPLLRAVKGHHMLAASALIEAGADLKRRGRKDAETVLHWAALYGDPEIARLLLRAGADPNAMDRNGKTPLAWARGRTPIERLLREAGATEASGVAPTDSSGISDRGDAPLALPIPSEK